MTYYSLPASFVRCCAAGRFDHRWSISFGSCGFQIVLARARRGACFVALSFASAVALTTSASAQSVASVATGYAHTMFIKTDGTLWAVGLNRQGQLGDGVGGIFRRTPVQVATNVASVATGREHTLFVKKDGTLWAVGDNPDGQLGIGTPAKLITPVQVATDVASVAGGGQHTVFVKTDGTLWAMGSNRFGQLGDGTTTSRSTPVRVTSAVATVAAGFGYTVFVKTDGTLWAVGLNEYGQLGDGTTTNRSNPIQVGNGVASVAAGSGHSVFVKKDGTLWAMGANHAGQLGDGTGVGTKFKSSPVQVQRFATSSRAPGEMASDVVSVSAGDSHTLFVDRSGFMYGAGSSSDGRLGNIFRVGAPEGSSAGIKPDVVSVAAGYSHSMYITKDGTLWAMGSNDYGQLGDGTQTNQFTPVRVVWAPTAPAIVTQALPQDVSAGAVATFAVVATGDPNPTYQWRKDGVPLVGATNSTLTLTGVTSVNAGSYTLVVSNPAGSVTSNAATLSVTSVSAPPTITTQQMGLYISAGGSGTFSVTAAGSPTPTYQWQKDGNPIAGATNSSLTMNNVTAANAGRYSVVISNSFGSITSNAASLVVARENQYVDVGPVSPNFTLTNHATGQPIRLSDFAGKIVVLEFFAQWCEPSALSAPDMQRNVHDYFAARGGNQYGVPVQLISVNIDSSNPAATDAFIRTHGLGLVADDRNEAVFRMFADPPAAPALGIPYFVVINGVANSPQDAQWGISAKALGYSGSRSASMRFVVDSIKAAVAPPVLGSVPFSQTAATNSDITLSAAVYGEGLNYQWFRNGLPLAGETQSTLPLRAITSAKAGAYTVTVANAAGTITTQPAIVFVNPPPAPPPAPVQPTAPPAPPTLVVSTLAGTVFASSVVGSSVIDGPGAEARFSFPRGVAIDETGTTYVGDGNHTIRKITNTGVVATLAGQRNVSWNGSAPVDGAGSVAVFFSPEVAAVDATGNVYVIDSGYLRKITPAGVVSTISKSYPGGVAIDRAGNIFESARFENIITKRTPAGVVTVVAGNSILNGLTYVSGSVDGIGSAARFKEPRGIAVDAAGTLYVADSGNSTIRRISSAGVVTTLAGLAGSAGQVDGVGTAARLNKPSSVTLDAAGNLYFTSDDFAADNTGLLRRVAPDGRVDTVAGGKVRGSTDGTGTAALFGGPLWVATNSQGTLILADNYNYTIRKAVWSVPPPPPAAAPLPVVSRLTNLSVRAPAGTGDQSLIVGFVSSGTAAKQLLLRAAGPALTQFGVGGAITNPALTLFRDGALSGQNDDWGDAPAIVTASAQVGAFPLPAASRDAALVSAIQPGSYTAQVAGVGGATGIALVEAYDADATVSGTRFVNLSARNQVGAGDNILIVGFALGGETNRTLLIRGIGPALTQFGVGGALSDPQLMLYAGGTAIAANDNWSIGPNATQISAAAAQVSAFALANGSRDAALLLTLSPGSYTVQASGVNGTTGVGLVEVYEVP